MKMAFAICEFSKNFQGSLPLGVPDPLRDIFVPPFALNKLCREKNTLKKMSKFDVPSLKRFLNMPPEIFSKCLSKPFPGLTSLCLPRKKSHLHYTRSITPKRVTSGGIHLRDMAPGQHRNVAAVASRWRQLFDLTGPGSSTMTYPADSDVFNHQSSLPVVHTPVDIQHYSKLPPTEIFWIRSWS